MKFKRFLFIKRGKKSVKKLSSGFSMSKRQKFIISILFLSGDLFLSQYLLGREGLIFAFLISFITVILLYITNYKDIRENFSFYYFILPFFFSLSFGLFYFLIPARFLTRTIMTTLYMLGLYSMFLSQNIFAVGSMRTIALLSSARTVSFILTLVSYFFLSNVVFTLDIGVLSTALILFVYTFFLAAHSIWTYTLDRSYTTYLPWFSAIAFCLFEVALVLWFWPSTPTLIALFLTGLFYTIVGLSHVWFDKRLFRNVLWEYIWVAVLVSLILFLFTSWKA